MVNWTNDNWARVISGSNLYPFGQFCGTSTRSLATRWAITVECLGSVLIVTIMVGAEKIYLSLRHASQQ